MAVHPPFMNSTGLIPKIFGKIAEAQQTDRFTQDYLGTVLGYSSGSARPIIPLLKRLQFVNADGTPTELYARFRSPSERASAMLEALKHGYPTLYARSEFAHVLGKDKLRDLVVQTTGLQRDSSVVNGIVGTFLALKAVGGIDENTKVGVSTPAAAATPAATSPPVPVERPDFVVPRNGDGVGMNLSYTINLNLPPSKDPEVFNAIFRAIKEHLIGK